MVIPILTILFLVVKMKRLLVILLFCAFKANANPLYKLENEIYVCGFKTYHQKFMTLCIDTNQQYLVYRFGSENKVELEYPKDKTKSWELFVYSFYYRGGGKENAALDLNELTFKKGDYSYKVYQYWSAETEETECGIEVKNTRKNRISTIRCNPLEILGSLGSLRFSNKIIIGEDL